MLPALISAGTSILGGILGRRSERKAESRARKAAAKSRKVELADQQAQFSRLRSAAEAGGFNPLTVLGATGGAGFAPSTGIAPPAASNNALLNGFLSAAETYAYSSDPARELERESQVLRNDLMKLQIEEMSDVPRAARPSVGGASAPSRGSFDHRKSHVTEKIMTDADEVLDVPVGPEIDEMISGQMLNVYGSLKSLTSNALARPDLAAARLRAAPGAYIRNAANGYFILGQKVVEGIASQLPSSGHIYDPSTNAPRVGRGASVRR